MNPNKPIHTIEQDCDRCHGKYKGYCLACQGKGKTTKLIFKAEDFECKEVNLDRRFYSTPHFKLCKCKGTGLILPKKNEVKMIHCPYIDEQYHWKGCNHCYLRGDKRFHLTSDAEIKELKKATARDFGIDNDTDWLLFVERFDQEHNLKEDSKIVIVRGYYE